MGHDNEFNLLSTNVRGIRTFEKRKAVFSWLVNSDVDIFFLQKTYSARDIENIWRKQWKGEVFFSHGSNHSEALVRDNLDFKVHSIKVDSQAPCKRTQLCSPTTPNIVGCYMLRPFAHPTFLLFRDRRSVAQQC